MRTLKAGGGSGDLPKIIINNNVYYTVEDGMENCLEIFTNYNDTQYYAVSNPIAKEIFMYNNDELINCMWVREK